MDSEKDSSRSHPTSCSWWRKADFVAVQGQKYAVTVRMSAQQPCSAHTLSAQRLPAFSLQFSPCLVMRLFSFLAQLDFLSFAYLNHHLREKNKKFKHITNFYKHFSLSPTLYPQPLTAMSQIHVEEVEVTLDISDQSKAVKTSITVLFQYKSSVLIFFYYIPKLKLSCNAHFCCREQLSCWGQCSGRHHFGALSTQAAGHAEQPKELQSAHRERRINTEAWKRKYDITLIFTMASCIGIWKWPWTSKLTALS